MKRMCNGKNHPANCICAFSGGNSRRFTTAHNSHSLPTPTLWKYRDDDFSYPTTCPQCGAKVYFVRHNGGCVWFDKLGQPWPKHSCFDDGYGLSLRQSFTVENQAALTPVIFGVITETVATDPGIEGRIIVHCVDGTVINEQFNTTIDLTKIAGALVIVSLSNQGEILLTLVRPVPTMGATQKVPCLTCKSLILPETAKKYSGMCMPCFKNTTEPRIFENTKPRIVCKSRDKVLLEKWGISSATETQKYQPIGKTQEIACIKCNDLIPPETPKEMRGMCKRCFNKELWKKLNFMPNE